MMPIGPLMDAATREWTGAQPDRIIIRNPNDAAAVVTIFRSGTDRLNARSASINYSGATGRRLSASPPPGPAVATAGVMLGLHIGAFAGPVLRWTYFLLGLTGAAMVGTGLLLWTAKRRKAEAAPFFGFRFVERLNIGAIACLPAGMAACLLANRLIPADLPGRASIEVAAMFWVWFGLAALSVLRPVKHAWRETLGIAAFAFASLPVVSLATTDRGFVHSMRTGDGLFLAFDFAFIATALLLAFAAWRAGRLKQIKVARRTRRASVALVSAHAA